MDQPSLVDQQVHTVNDIFLIRTDQNILDLYEQLLVYPASSNGTLEVKFTNLSVKKKSLLPSFMRAGFVPTLYYCDGCENIQFHRWWLTFIFSDVRETGNQLRSAVANFWGRWKRSFFGAIDLKLVKKWTYKNIEGYRQQALAKGGSLGLFLCAPQLLYQSNRPRTHMSMFRGALSRTIKRTDIKMTEKGEQFVHLDDVIWYVLPVTRYAAGMSKGTYFTEEDKTEFCDTSLRSR